MDPDNKKIKQHREAISREFRPCMGEKVDEWVAHLYDSTALDIPCTDCTPEYRDRMKERGLCHRDVIFIRHITAEDAVLYIRDGCASADVKDFLPMLEHYEQRKVTIHTLRKMAALYLTDSSKKELIQSGAMEGFDTSMGRRALSSSILWKILP